MRDLPVKEMADLIFSLELHHQVQLRKHLHLNMVRDFPSVIQVLLDISILSYLCVSLFFTQKKCNYFSIPIIFFLFVSFNKAIAKKGN